MQVIVFPDAVAVGIAALRAGLTALSDTAPVHREVPVVRPSRWVQVVRTGGTRATIVSDAAQLTISAWADRADFAAALAQRCRAISHATIGTVVAGVPVYLVEELGGPYDNPDPTSGQERHTWTCRVHLRGVAV